MARHAQDFDSEVVLACYSWVVDIDENILVFFEAEVQGSALVVSAVGSTELVVARVETQLQILLVEHFEQVALHTVDFQLNHFKKV